MNSVGGGITINLMSNEHLFIHLSMAGHNGFLNDVSITFIDKTDQSDPLRREDYWRQTPETMVPYGLNIENSI